MDSPIIQKRYALAEWLGGGTFSEVYRAHDQHTGQDVAMKFLRPGKAGANETRIASFQRELRLGAQLNHPNIVGLIDSGQDAAGRLFAVFQLVPGQTLAQQLTAHGRIPARRALRWMTQVLDALVCAHRARVIHRDLKPGNIIIHPAGRNTQAMVVDFGIGGLAGESGSKREPGTLAYAAPEQLRDEPVSAGSDLFSWALILLECLTGTTVIHGATAQDLAFRKLNDVAIALPPALECQPLGRLLKVLLRKDASKRLSSADEVMTVLLDEIAGSEEALRVLQSWQENASTLELTAHAPPPRERRWCTMLAVDVAPPSNSPPSQDHAGLAPTVTTQIEPAPKLLDQTRSLLKEEIQAHGGLLVQADFPPYVGCFGWLQARTNEAAHAAAAAQEIAAALPNVRWRIGLKSGPVKMGRYRQPMLGRTGHSAAELARGADAHTTLVDNLAASTMASELVAADRPRGVDNAHRLRPLTQRQHGAAPQAWAETQASPPALVGRDREIAWLAGEWKQASSGVGRCVLVTGDKGMGKSALAKAVTRTIPESKRDLLVAHCRVGHDTAALVEMLERRVARSHANEDALAARAAFVAEVGLPPDEGLPLIEQLLGPPGAPRTSPLDDEGLELIVDLLFELGAQRPVLLVVENADAAGQATLKFLERIIDEVEAAAILVLVLARPTFIPSWDRAKTSVIPLDPLSESDIGVLAESCGQTLSAADAQELLELSAGKPQLVKELLTPLQEGAETQLPRVGSRGQWRISPRLCQWLSAELERRWPWARNLNAQPRDVGLAFPPNTHGTESSASAQSHAPAPLMRYFINWSNDQHRERD